MRLQFVIKNNFDNPIDINISREITDEEYELIQNEIYNNIDSYEEENGDLDGFDWYDCIYNAVEKYISIKTIPIERIFYIY